MNWVGEVGLKLNYVIDKWPLQHLGTCEKDLKYDFQIKTISYVAKTE